MRDGRTFKAVLVGVTLLLCVASASAQQVRFFPNFSSVANLQMDGSAHQATYGGAKVLRLTDGYPGIGATHPETSASWFALQQKVNSGFTTYFKFQIHTAAICCSPADGFAFVIQNSSTSALGSGFGGLAYAGIPNSVAVEFDTFQNSWDPSANHVAVQSCGTQPNSAMHNGNCLVASGINSNIPHLGVTCGTSTCADGTPHEVVVKVWAPGANAPNTTVACSNQTSFGHATPVSRAKPTSPPATSAACSRARSQARRGCSSTAGLRARPTSTTSAPSAAKRSARSASPP